MVAVMGVLLSVMRVITAVRVMSAGVLRMMVHNKAMVRVVVITAAIGALVE